MSFLPILVLVASVSAQSDARHAWYFSWYRSLLPKTAAVKKVPLPSRPRKRHAIVNYGPGGHVYSAALVDENPLDRQVAREEETAESELVTLGAEAAYTRLASFYRKNPAAVYSMSSDLIEYSILAEHWNEAYKVALDASATALKSPTEEACVDVVALSYLTARRGKVLPGQREYVARYLDEHADYDPYCNELKREILEATDAKSVAFTSQVALTIVQRFKQGRVLLEMVHRENPSHLRTTERLAWMYKEGNDLSNLSRLIAEEAQTENESPEHRALVAKLRHILKEAQ